MDDYLHKMYIHTFVRAWHVYAKYFITKAINNNDYIKIKFTELMEEYTFLMMYHIFVL
jgi:hypothetical protein